ncbi:hypothetical protein VIOR3934_19635 [Vibrio orientalis CIP 102891 = ATCC 33934]|uniref:Uncharacterized protein n=1 Tax=Vibrio orientalis CIP 102891 = ATCC 33934 TaxID=675816 RepID=F9SML7_VIBOR|nr:hypothetical protein [Vibrio orientalis]EGU54072.1 hypothetical protein VIOR3934_19635 [Vibrio orientalis CIP 102891 = ATCC 33934]
MIEDEAKPMTHNERVFTEIISLLFNCLKFTEELDDLKNTTHIDKCINDVQSIAGFKFSLKEDKFISRKLCSAIMESSPRKGDIYTEIFHNVPRLWAILTVAFDDFSKRVLGHTLSEADESAFQVNILMDTEYCNKNLGSQIVEAYFN